jgi:NADH-quinone oxidoreductase subunit H
MEFLKDLILNIGRWFQGLLASTGLPDTWLRVIALAASAFALACVPLVAMFLLIWLERKVVARIGSRIGPNNSGAYGGPCGLLQVLADTIKLFTKEDVIPTAADRWVFNIAPMLVMAVAVLIWAVIPLGQGLIGSDLNIGVFYILSLGSGSMVGMLMAGWGSDNKYALVAALRGIATLISYEIPQTLSVLAVVMVAGSFSMQDIIVAQDVAFLFALPLTALLFLVSALSELGRRPFDLVEADSEIVAGYFIEYSGIKFGMFYVAEFVNQLAMAAIFSTLFLGGWRGPWVDRVPVLSTLWLTAKVLLCTLVIQFCQYTLPRLRIDQVLRFNWKFLTPLALVNICVVALVGKAVPASADPWVRAGAFLGANVLLALGVLGVLAGRRYKQAAASR